MAERSCCSASAPSSAPAVWTAAVPAVQPHSVHAWLEGEMKAGSQLTHN